MAQVDKKELFEAMGWIHYMHSDDDYEWIKFDENGNRIAREGDLTWEKDLESLDAPSEAINQ